MENHSIPRLPTQAELDQLVAKFLELYMNPTEEDRETEQGFIANAYISVFDDYCTDAPGYSGKLMCVVWSGAESFYEVYIWNDHEQIERVNQDIQFRIDDENE